MFCAYFDFILFYIIVLYSGLIDEVAEEERRRRLSFMERQRERMREEWGAQIQNVAVRGRASSGYNSPLSNRIVGSIFKKITGDPEQSHRKSSFGHTENGNNAPIAPAAPSAPTIHSIYKADRGSSRQYGGNNVVAINVKSLSTKADHTPVKSHSRSEPSSLRQVIDQSLEALSRRSVADKCVFTGEFANVENAVYPHTDKDMDDAPSYRSACSKASNVSTATKFGLAALSGSGTGTGLRIGSNSGRYVQKKNSGGSGPGSYRMAAAGRMFDDCVEEKACTSTLSSSHMSMGDAACDV